MKKLLLAASVLTFAALPAQAQEFSAEQKSAIEKMIADYIANNPQAMIESLENHRMAQEAAAEEQAAAAAKDVLAEIESSDTIPSVGPDDADVTIVEYFDYNCGYCKKAYDELAQVLEADKKVKVYFKEYPILGPSSTEAAKWALAADKQGKYFEYHVALMEHQGQKSASVLEDIAKKVGLDVDQMKKDKEGDDIQALINANMESAAKLGVRGTPGFIIEDEIFRGYLTLDQMKEVIASKRSDS